jgi:exodeoxyribonuclease VII large subunit
VQERLQLLDDLQGSLLRGLKVGWRDALAAWQGLRQRLLSRHPASQVAQRRQTCQQLHRRLGELARQRWATCQHRAAEAQARLELLSPMNVLGRGYSITTDAAGGGIIRAADQVRPGQRLRTQLHRGRIQSVVESGTDPG